MKEMDVYDGHQQSVVIHTDRSSVDECLRTLKEEGHGVIVCIIELTENSDSQELKSHIKGLSTTKHGIPSEISIADQ